MDSLSTIISKLTSIADTMGYTGPTVDAIIYLAANSIYLNNTNAITAILEASPSRCKLTNSAIQHAKDVGFSVNRGRNQHILAYRLTAVESKSYKKFDQAAKVGNYYLYFAEDINVTSGTEYKIEFILGKNVLEESIEVLNTSDLLKLKSSNINYTSDIDFRMYINDEIIQVPFTEYKRQLFDLNSNYKYWMATSTDYSVEIYIFPKDLEESSTTQFKAGDRYIIKGIEYLNDTISLSAIKTIPGFRFELTSDIKPEDLFRSIERENRTEDPNKIYQDSMKYLDSSFVIRSTEDIEHEILALNNNIKACKIVTTAPETIEVDDSLTTDLGIIYVYYLTEYLDDIYGISSTEKNLIQNTLRNSYYVNQKFNFQLAKGYRIVDNGVLRKYKLYLNVFYNTNINTGYIEDFIHNYNYSIGTTFDPNKIIGDLVSNFKEIVYVSFQKVIYGNELDDTLSNTEDSDISIVKLKANEFIDFDLKVNYEAIM